MDANLAALLTVLVTSITTIIVTVINGRKSDRIEKSSASIEKKVDAGNAVTTATHTIANGRTEQLLRELAEKNNEIQRLSLLVPPPTEKQ